MGKGKTAVDASSPEEIGRAIRRVQSDPALRSQYGIKALWEIYNAPNHTVIRSEMDAREGVLDLHFGWFCRRVAEELGASEPDALALVDFSVDPKGCQLLTLKPSVVAALKPPKSKIK